MNEKNYCARHINETSKVDQKSRTCRDTVNSAK